MKIKNIYFALLGSILLLVGCGPVYKCGEERPTNGVQGSSRLLEVVNERDQLCDFLAVKEEENTHLIKKNQFLAIQNDSLIESNSEMKDEIHSLEGNITDLTSKNDQLKEEKLEIAERYSSAVTTNLNQGHLYDERIKEKERRLEQRENDLAAREARIKELEKQLAQQDSLAERLQYLIKQALLGFDSDELTTEIKDGKVYVSMSDKLMFASGKTDVQPKGLKALAALSEVLNKNKDFKILVEGHTDNVPINTSKFSDNWDLSVVRATSIVRLLQDNYKIDPLRLTASGRGEYKPKASNATAEGKAKNRRTEIILYPAISATMNNK